MTAQSSLRLPVPTSSGMRELGAALGRASRGGDVIVLTGELGAGKTTLAQGIGQGLGISERVTSPTFVISRVHRNPGGRPDLVHVDAYRLGSLAEMDDLDLETDLDHSVVVVEWGAGMADDLSESRLEVLIDRSGQEADETRVVTLTARGGHWAEALGDLATGVASR